MRGEAASAILLLPQKNHARWSCYGKSYRQGVCPVEQVALALDRLLATLIGASLGPGVGSAAKVRMQEMDKRELQLSDVARGNHKETDPRRARAFMDQVSEDFQRLLKLHNEIVRAIASNDSPNYQFISDATGEIKKRATRLQSTLELHKPETPETQREMQDLGSYARRRMI